MGDVFRDICDFNKALLAKQGWRILQNSDSLVAKFLKAKFFSRNFITAHVENRASYVWRSIREGREVLKEGVRWRVGNGRQIKVWGERWIYILYDFKVISKIGFYRLIY